MKRQAFFGAFLGQSGSSQHTNWWLYLIGSVVVMGTLSTTTWGQSSGPSSLLAFRPPQRFNTVAFPDYLAMADVNQDGTLDVLAGSVDRLGVLLGNGDGTFQAFQEFGVGTTTTSMALGDVNADGWLDIATANFNSDDVSILLGNGDGTFQAARKLPGSSDPLDVALGDLNGDGKLDLAVANQGSSNVGVLLGNGDGTFQAAQTLIL